MWQVSSWPRCHRHWASLVVVTALLVGSFTPGFVKPVAAASGDWPQFRSGPTRDGYNSAEGILSTTNVGNLVVAWTADRSDWLEASPAVANGVVYAAFDTAGLTAYTVGCAAGGGTCTPLWTGTGAGGFGYSSPAVANGVVYVASSDSKLYAFDAAGGAANCTGSAPNRTCTPLWTAATGALTFSSPVVANGVVYVGSYDGKLYAFDAAGGAANCAGTAPNRTCTPLWTATVGPNGVYSSPAVANGVVYIGSQNAKLYAFDAAGGDASCTGSAPNRTCTPLWTAITSGSIVSAPAVANGMVYLGSSDGTNSTLYAFDAAGGAANCTGSAPNRTCTPLWTAATGATNYPVTASSPAVANGVVYIGSYDHKLYAFDAAGGAANCTGTAPNRTCSPLWTAATGASIYSSPAVANGVVYVASINNKLYALDAAGGAANCTGSAPNRTCTPLWTSGSLSGNPPSSPAIANGVVYIGSGNYGKLYAFALSGLDHLGLSPASATIAAGASQAYTAEAFGPGPTNTDLGDVTSATTFTISGGGSCTGTSCTSTIAGDHTVTGTDGAATGTATLHVNAGPLNHLTLSPAGATIQFGANQTYTARGIDAYGNDLGDVTSASTFTISTGGSCTGAACGSTVPSDYTVTGTDGSATGTATLHVIGATYHAITPTRVLDTRNGTGGLSGPFTNHAARTFQVTGGSSGVPSNATAVTGNLTVTGQTSGGYLFIGPVATNSPGSSTLNFPIGDDRANAVTVALGAGGTLSIAFVAPSNGPTANAIFDVTGYFTPDTTGATYHAISPTRALDTRNGTGGLSGPFTNHVARTFTLGGVPAGATAVTGNLTVTGQTSGGYLFIGPVATNSPGSSTLNFPIGDDRANAVTVALGSGGTLSITFVGPNDSQSAQAIFDVTGYFTADMTGATYVPLDPTRTLDTRNGTGGLLGPFTNHVARTFTLSGVPAGATAVTGNLTVTGQTSSGYLSVGPVATNNPGSSTLNFPVGDDRANAVAVQLGAGGTLSITFVAPSNGPSANAIFDVTGYFVPAGG